MECEEEPSKEAGKMDQGKNHDSYDYWCPISPEENEEEIGGAEEIP